MSSYDVASNSGILRTPPVGVAAAAAAPDGATAFHTVVALHTAARGRALQLPRQGLTLVHF